MKIAIVTDAWTPQVNGVVTTLQRTAAALEKLKHEVRVFSSHGHMTIPRPTYPEIRLALWPRKRLAAELDELAPDAIHVATEGPLGMAAARYCAARGFAFTTSYHTQFPAVRAQAPADSREPHVCIAAAPSFAGAPHARVRTEHQRRELVAQGFAQCRAVVARRRHRAVSTARPRPSCSLPRPIFAYLGRVAVEKNIDAFLDLDLPGTKVVIGDGPASRDATSAAIPSAVFLGYHNSASSSRRLLSSAPTSSFSEPHRHVRARDARGAWPAARRSRPIRHGPDRRRRRGVTGVLDEDLRHGGAAQRSRSIARAAGAPPANGRGSVPARSSFGHLVRARDGRQDLAARGARSVAAAELRADPVRRLAQQPGIARAVAMERGPA